LRTFLPGNFFPPPHKHSYSTYQKILTQARSDWKNSPFPSLMPDLIAAPAAEVDKK
jgi:hypothetical protein